MGQKSSNQKDQEKIKEKLVRHIENRQKIRKIYADKGIQMLDKQDLLIKDIQDPLMSNTLYDIYNTIQSELSQKGYSHFRFLGQGAQGLVVLAKDQLTNKRFAIKGIQIKDSKGNVDQQAVKQVNQEINILNECKGSPYVVNFVRKIEGQQFVYLVLTECLGTLNQIIQKNPDQKLNELSVIKYAKDITEGLYFIHSKKCLVNDLKMDNILIDYNGNAVICDFGAAENLPKQSNYALNLYVFLTKANSLLISNKFVGQFRWATLHIRHLSAMIHNIQKFILQSTKNQELLLKESQVIEVKHVHQVNKPIEMINVIAEIIFKLMIGYLIYTMISGFSSSMMFNKHNPLPYKPEFQNFTYKKQLQYIIDGLTQFIPRNRFEIKDVLIILKGIISFEFSLDSRFIELVEVEEEDKESFQQLIKNFNNEIELVQHFKNKFYPVMYVVFQIL